MHSAIPRATYRLQLREEFNFGQAAALAGYLAELGISHLYTSPVLRSRPGSSHGYDAIDYGVIDPQLGGAEGFQRLIKALREHGLQLITDFVPNHMGVGGADNELWLSVLEWGPSSDCAKWFDIDWHSDRQDLQNKVLVPILGTQYGLALLNGDLSLEFDPESGTLAVWAYGTHKLPICPLHYHQILGDDPPELERIGDDLEHVREIRPHFESLALELKQELGRVYRENEEIARAINRAVERFRGNPSEISSWDRLNRLIAQQHWRPAYFRVAADDINYRRFFNVNELAGIRMEVPDVFADAHRLMFELLQSNAIGGLRIDHIDGLLDPKQYLEWVRQKGPDTSANTFLVVEKILAHHEPLPEDWPVQGTTGYDFSNVILGFLTDAGGEESLTRTYQEFTGETRSFPEIARLSKIRIMENEMASELTVLARSAARIARQNPQTADFTQNILQKAIQEIVACFPVYRIYVDQRAEITETDRRYLQWAVAQARANQADVDPTVFDFILKLLSGDLAREHHSGFSRYTVLQFAMKTQQYCGPVMAKGLEDTAFYRYNRFIALNEVGSSPEQFGLSVAAFHKANIQRLKYWPHTMLATSTHDTKRGEDVRARLAVLSELPDEWSYEVRSWSRILRARRADIEGTAPPDRNDEYLFYQLLLGTWPPELTATESLDSEILRTYAERIKGAMIKSVRESKVHSTWTAPNTEYEAAVLGFIDECMDPERSKTFFSAFLPFQERIAKLGVQNSLVQTVLKLTVPGVPDIYQGSELWNFSMVDPDNRRPVDYILRQRLLGDLNTSAGIDGTANIDRLLREWPTGAVKLWITANLLSYRKSHSTLFENGSYEPLDVQGEETDQFCAFLRRREDDKLLVAVTRFPTRRENTAPWNATHVILPDDVGNGSWTNLLTGHKIHFSGAIPASNIFGMLPFSVFVGSHATASNVRQ